jgi:streptogramin lyase
MPVLRPSPSDYTTVVKALANAGAAVSNPQGSRPASKGSVAFVNVASVSAIIRGSPRFVPTIIPRPPPTLPIDPNKYTVYQTSLISINDVIWNKIIARDTSGNLYYRNAADYKYYKIPSGGGQTFLAGNNTYGNFIPGVGAAAQFTLQPRGIVVDSSNNLFVVENNIPRIIKIEPNGNVTSFAGSGTAGYTDGGANTAEFNELESIAIDASNTLYVHERGRKTIRKITSSGQVSTLTFSSASTLYFSNIAVDSLGVIYAAEPSLHRVYKITPTGPTTADIALLAGSTAGYANGQGSAAQFNLNTQSGLCVDMYGNVYVGDNNNGSVRKITPSSNVITIFGNGTNGTTDTSTQLQNPGKLVVDSNGVIYIATSRSFQKITPVS